MTKTLTAVLALAGLLAVPAFAQSSIGEDTAPIGSTEFGVSATENFTRRDVNRDGNIDQAEYEAGERRRYDRDRDGELNAEEAARYREDARAELED